MYISKEDIDLLIKHHEFIDSIRHNDIVDLKHLSEISNISWSTTKKYLSELVDLGVVTERCEGTTPRYCINKDFGFFLGIAIGATEIKLSFVGFDYEPIDLSVSSDFDCLRKEITEIFDVDPSGRYFCCHTQKDYLFIYNLCSQIVEIALGYFDIKKDKKLLSVGISIPGIIDRKSQVISFCPNFLEIENCKLSTLIRSDLLDELSKRNIRPEFCHDTVAALLYEKEHLYLSDNLEHEYSKSPNMVSIFMGSGLSASFILQNRLVYGASYCAGEIGHFDLFYNEECVKPTTDKEIQDKNEYLFNGISENNVNVESQPCACGKKFCLEHLIRTKVFNSISTEDYIQKTKTDFLSRFAKDHPYRYKVLKHFISQILNICINMLNVNVIVLSGRILNSIPELKKEIEGLKVNSALKISSNHCNIIKGSGRADATAIGASILAYLAHIGTSDNIQW